MIVIVLVRWNLSALGKKWASSLKISDLEPSTPQVNAEMLFEKLNLTALLIGAAFKTRRAQRTVKRGMTHEILRRT
jgi:hypothetical protein